jgi:hypothetical protein
MPLRYIYLWGQLISFLSYIWQFVQKTGFCSSHAPILAPSISKNEANKCQLGKYGRKVLQQAVSKLDPFLQLDNGQ